MASADRITLIIEGLPEDHGRVGLKTFMSQIQSLSHAISKLDRDANSEGGITKFEIAELSYSSPVRVGLEPQIAAGSQAGHRILAGLHSFADALSTGKDLSGYDFDVLEDFHKLASPVGRRVKAAALLINGVTFDLTREFATRAQEALATVEECEGAIDGMLEQINIHHSANTFHVYPEIGPKKVTCKFPSKLYDDAVAAVGRRVEVAGILQYRAGADFPHQVAVSEIDIYERIEELPDWDDIRGLAPDATGGLSSEEFVRELRDAWL